MPATAEQAARHLRPADLDRDDLRGPEADAASAAVASVPGVRAALLAFQRDFAAQSRRGAGRARHRHGDFSDAAAKLFVTASLAERARRRWLELRAKGNDTDIGTVEQDMRQRDAKDAARAAAPLRAADDAFQLDTSDMDAEAAFQSALTFIQTRLRRSNPKGDSIVC